jgi:hypothetical protein
MNAAAIRRRLKRLEARHLDSAPKLPPTVAERVTRFMRAKHIEHSKRVGQLHGADDPPEPFDWDATLERVRRMSIERGHDPDARY